MWVQVFAGLIAKPAKGARGSVNGDPKWTEVRMRHTYPAQTLPRTATAVAAAHAAALAAAHAAAVAAARAAAAAAVAAVTAVAATVAALAALSAGPSAL